MPYMIICSQHEPWLKYEKRATYEELQSPSRFPLQCYCLETKITSTYYARHQIKGCIPYIVLLPTHLCTTSYTLSGAHHQSFNFMPISASTSNPMGGL